MSLASWMAEFYPIPADKVPIEQAVSHSLQKWIGLRQANLENHDCKINRNNSVCEVGTEYDRHSEVLEIQGSSCSLCHHHRIRLSCKTCPLYQHLGGRQCDNEQLNGTSSAFDSWQYDTNPEPMIKALEGTLAYGQSQKVQTLGRDTVTSEATPSDDTQGKTTPDKETGTVKGTDD